MAMILSAFVPSLMRILSQMVQDEVGMLLGVPGEVDKLTSMVYRVEGVLIDAERRQNESEAIYRWVKQLKDVMYDADDVIDLCCMKADKGRARCGSSSSSNNSCGIHFLSCFRNPVYARKIAGKIKELNLRMNAIVSEIGLLGLIENRGVSSNAPQMASNITIRKTHPVVVLSDLVGEKIGEDTEQLVELLTKDATQGQGNIPIFAIVGMGGIGKTTLAKNVYNDPRIKKDYFQHLIWVCISNEIKPVDLLKNVIREVEGDCGAAVEISELIPRLEEYIRGKKFLLVLDDIWPESEKVWSDMLRYPMIKGGLGSKVLITTRDSRVAMQMGAIYTLKVNRLSDEDGWSLLVKKVAPNGIENEIQDLKDIGMQVVKKCDGLPLAIKSIGGVLCTKGNTRNNWEGVLRSNAWSMGGLPGDLHHAFYLSFEDLPPPLKQCFIFCSLFPEDFEFWKNNLIFMWLAEGFLQDKDNFWELGNDYYMELLLRNLLEVSGQSVDQVQCKMHDLLWSFARHLGKDENYVLWERQILSRPKDSLKIQRLSIEGNEVNTEVIKKENGLRTLLLRGKSEVALDDLCKVVSKLRILDLYECNISSLPNSLCDLVHMRYLDVANSKIKNLPNSIGNLKYLQYLNLGGCKNLSHIPRSIINLQELKLLNTSNSGVEAFPAGLNKLDKLVNLYGFKPDKNSLEGFSSLDGIETLSQLINLHLFSLENVSDKNIAKGANLQNKDRLQELTLFYSSSSWNDQISHTNEKKVTTEDVLNELCPPRSLEFLKIVNYFGSSLPNWLNLEVYLPNLRFLEIRNCACIKRLAPLGKLPNLDCLRIIGACSVVSVEEEFLWVGIQSIGTPTTSCHAKPAFPKLRQLEFERMPNWKEWHWNKGQLGMSKLKKLFIMDCPQLRSLPEGLLLHATSLEYLEIDGANNLIIIENFPSIKCIVLRNPILERISNLSSNSYIFIQECQNLKVVENLQALQMMELKDYKMKILPDYLMMTMPQKLRIWCSEELLFKITSQGESGSEWNKFKHIPKVTIYSQGNKFYATYMKTPFTFTTNINTRPVQMM